jgi:glutathione peroxidase
VGAQANPFYEALFKATTERPKWNFHKYLVSADAGTVRSFASNVAPESSQLTTALEALLAAK